MLHQSPQYKKALKRARDKKKAARTKKEKNRAEEVEAAISGHELSEKPHHH